MNSVKECRKCRLEKYLNEFNPDRLGRYGVGSTCKTCIFEHKKPQKELVRTPISQIGTKRKERIKKNGSEGKVFVELWIERVTPDGKRECENCGGHIKFFHASCFAHKYNKRDHPELRYVKTNIAIVHGIFETMDDTGKTYNCHKEYDLKFNKIKSIL